MNPRNVAILLFDDVEVLDFAGPFEVFAVASELHDYSLFRVFTVAASAGPIRARNGLSVFPDYPLESAPRPDVLVIPGGVGTRALMSNTAICGWIAAAAGSAQLTLSVCSGALLLAKAGYWRDCGRPLIIRCWNCCGKSRRIPKSSPANGMWTMAGLSPPPGFPPGLTPVCMWSGGCAEKMSVCGRLLIWNIG